MEPSSPHHGSRRPAQVRARPSRTSLVAHIHAVDANRGQRAAVTVGALAKNFDPAAIEQLDKPHLRTLGKRALLRAASLDLRRVDVEDPHGLGLACHPEP